MTGEFALGLDTSATSPSADVTVALTSLSLVPDVMPSAGAATKARLT